MFHTKRKKSKRKYLHDFLCTFSDQTWQKFVLREYFYTTSAFLSPSNHPKLWSRRTSTVVSQLPPNRWLWWECQNFLARYIRILQHFHSDLSLACKTSLRSNETIKIAQNIFFSWLDNFYLDFFKFSQILRIFIFAK